MLLRQEYKVVELVKIKRQKEKDLKKLWEELWIWHPEYQEKYDSIIKSHEIEVQRILNI